MTQLTCVKYAEVSAIVPDSYVFVSLVIVSWPVLLFLVAGAFGKYTDKQARWWHIFAFILLEILLFNLAFWIRQFWY